STMVTVSTCGCPAACTCTTTVSVDTAAAALRTVSVNVMSVGTVRLGATNVGVAVAAPTRVIKAPASCVHANDVTGPVEAAPRGETFAPAATVWWGPALATTGTMTGSTTATGTVMLPPPADVTCTWSGGGSVPSPTAADAPPVPVAVSTRGSRPSTIAV